MDISGLENGRSFTVKKHVIKGDVDKMPFLEQAKAMQEAAKFKDQNFSNVADNGKVDILIEGSDGVAVVSGKKINLAELGKAVPEVALELKKYDENDDNYLEEHEYRTSAGERFGSAGLAIAGSTAGAAGTGAMVTSYTGPGALVGAGVGALVGLVGSALWEGGKTVFWAMGDGYDSPDWLR